VNSAEISARGDNWADGRNVAEAVLIGAVPPLMLKTPANPAGTPMEVFDQIRGSVVADRSKFWKDLSLPFYGYNRSGAKISEGVRESFWLQGMMCGFPGSYFCIKAFSETDLTEDLRNSTCRRSSCMAMTIRSYRSAPRPCSRPRSSKAPP